MGKTAIIIPTCPGGEEYLARCLSTVLFYGKDYDYELFIVKNDFISFGYACNLAIKQVLNDDSIEDIFILNDDIVITSNSWLADMKEKLKTCDVCVTPQLLRKKHIAMGFALFKKEVFKKVGLFDEQFKIGEIDDIDLSIRLQDAGLTWDAINENPWGHLDGGSLTFKRAPIYNFRELNRERLINKYKNTKWENYVNELAEAWKK